MKTLLPIALALSWPPAAPARPSPTPASWFQETEQALMDAITSGDKSVWDGAMADDVIVTSEEGEVLTKQKFLADLRPLPPGLSGGIAVRELTVHEDPGFAIVRFLADEWEIVFGQKLTTRYRVTDTYRRAGTSWKIVASHLSVVTSDPPPQKVARDGFPGLVGVYQLLPDGWTFHVVLRDGMLFGGRDPEKLHPLVPLTPQAFVLSGSLGDWIFVLGKDGKATHILDFRKFEPLRWTRVSD
jgi:hypothetical protein